jgi:hypothetical protein
MKLPHRRSLAASALAALVLAVVGCGTMPTAPVLDTGAVASSSQSSKAPAPHAILGRGVIVQLPPVEDPIGAVVQGVTTIAGDVGGSIEVAKVTVRVPKDAITGDAVIKVTVPDSTKLECRLEISPAEKNHFDVPVTLEFDAKSVPDVRIMTVYWFDEDSKQWVPIPCIVDPVNRKISAELPHFSKYKADSELQGKAGW